MVFGMRKFLSLSLLGVLVLGSCQIRVPKEEIISVTQVTLSQATAEMVIGETVQLIATVLPANANEKSVNWASSAQSVAGVDPSGKVTALAVGTSTITASCGGKSATCQVTVSKAIVPVTSVTLDKNRLNLTVGAVETLVATVTPSDATDPTVTWSSSDETVAGVDQTGKVTARKGGVATILASAGDKPATAIVDVMEVTPASVTVKGTGGRFDVTVIAQRTYHISSKPDWITETSVESQVHHFKAAANDTDRDRTGVIAFCDEEGACLSCAVTQKGRTLLEADPDQLGFEWNGGQAEVMVFSTMAWSVSSDNSWCTVSPSAGSGDGLFTVSVTEFREVGERAATLTVSSGSFSSRVRVTQEGIVPFSVTPTSVELDEKGGTFELTVQGSFGYHLNGLPDWISEESSQNRTHVFRAAANPTDEQRTGSVTFCDDIGSCVSVTVRQAAHLPGPDQVNWDREFYHRSLLMMFTADWNFLFPRALAAVKGAQAQLPGRIEFVALHVDGALLFGPVAGLQGLYGISSYPVEVVDGRTKMINYASELFVDAVRRREEALPTVSTVGLRSSFSGQRLEMELFLFLKKAGQYKLTVLVLEDKVISRQTGSDESWIMDYRHDDVARVAVTPVLGEAFYAASDRSMLTRNYSVNIPSSYAKDNLRILVFIQRAYGEGVTKIDASDFDGCFVDNCADVKAGQTLLPAVRSGADGSNEDVTDDEPINW